MLYDLLQKPLVHEDGALVFWKRFNVTLGLQATA